MKIKTVLVVLMLVAVLITASACGIIEGQNYTLYRYIDTVYSLAPQKLIESYSNISNTQASMSVATIILPTTYEITCTINYSYTAYVPGTKPGTSTVQKLYGTVTKKATAFMINELGYMLTNASVITLGDNADLNDLTYESWTIKVKLPESENIFDASVIAYDTFLDLAVLRIDTTQVNTATLAYAVFFRLDNPSEKPSVTLYYGEPVVSLGNALGRGMSVTQAIISAPRQYFAQGLKVTSLIQIDRQIPEGSSGGPLCNVYARVIGMNTTKYNSEGANIGYAVPSYIILEYLDSINQGRSTGVIVTPNPRVKYYYTQLREYAYTNVYSNFSQ